MYRDPELIRHKVVKVRFSPEENALLEALADYTGDHKAALVRDLVLAQARRVLFGDQSAAPAPGAEVTQEMHARA